MASVSPSTRTCDLIRQGAERVLTAPEEWFRAIDSAALSTPSSIEIADDPTLSEAVRHANSDGVTVWATANLRAPGDPVPANTSPAQLRLARDLVRRGLDQTALDSYRTGQAAAWRQWMQICFGLTRDPDELEELLAITAASIDAFVSATIAALAQRMEGERATLTQGSEAERRDLVTLLLQGAPVSTSRAEMLLRHRLDGPHTAAIVWTTEHDADVARLEQAAEALMLAAGAHHRLTIRAAGTTLWIWLPVSGRLEQDRLATTLSSVPEVRVAIGTPATGVAGFRRTHRDAIEAQRFMVQPRPRCPRVMRFAEIELAALSTHDADRSARYVINVLGGFANAPDELRETVSTYIDTLGNASAAAARLFTHRNTVLRRVARANQLLPRPINEDPVRIGVAIEISRWQRTLVTE